MSITNSIIYFLKRKVLPGYAVSKKDFVIDIGSGDKPFWRANVFLDNLSLDNLQRSTYGNTISTIGNFVNGDITKTKFKDKAFDFSYCSHVLEHVERPDLAIKEITRISKAGYIEVPNGIIDFINPFFSHLWFVFLHKNKLVFFRKSNKLHNVLRENAVDYIPLSYKTNKPFIRLYWKNKIDYEIIDTNLKKFNPPSIEKVGNEKEKNNSIVFLLSKKWYIFFIKVLRKIHGINTQPSIKFLLKK